MAKYTPSEVNDLMGDVFGTFEELVGSEDSVGPLILTIVPNSKQQALRGDLKESALTILADLKLLADQVAEMVGVVETPSVETPAVPQPSAPETAAEKIKTDAPGKGGKQRQPVAA